MKAGASERLEALVQGLTPDCEVAFKRWLEAKAARFSPHTLAAIVGDFHHFAIYCDQQGMDWYPTDLLVLRDFVQHYRSQRHAGAIWRLVAYLRSANRAVRRDLKDAVLDEVVAGLKKESERFKSGEVGCASLQATSERLRDAPLDVYTRALLWTIYDSQFRIGSLLSVKLEWLKVLRPSGVVWLPPPKKPIRWEESGGFLPPSTAGCLRDWLAIAGITEGYLFPSIRQGRVTNRIGSRKQADRLVQSALREAGCVGPVTFRAVRSGAIADLKAANVGVPAIMRRAGYKTYKSVSLLFKNAGRLDSSSLDLAKQQNRWGIPYGY